MHFAQTNFSDVKEAISSKVSSIKVQDVALVVLCALVIYLFRVRDAHLISPQWRYQFNQSDAAHHVNRLPRPIITDLESDGVSEVGIRMA